MKRIRIFMIALFITSLFVTTGCSFFHQASPQPKTKDPIKAEIKAMNLDEKIGQMLITGISGTTLNSKSKALINHYKVGGIIFYGPNIQTTHQTMQLLNDLKAENTDNREPLFLSLDQEGGRVARLPKDWVNFPTNQAIGQVSDPDFSYKVGTLLGKEVKAVGFNMDFAPVMDINNNPNNPVIGDRSFGATPDIVTSLGIQTMHGIQSQHVISVIKHFPGHGDTSVDSHIGLPKVNVDLDRLRHFEMVPFAAAIKKGADVVMSAHILLPKIDPKDPASISKPIITGILRKDLHFKGVAMTDDLTMGAIETHYGIGDAAVKAVNAGENLLLVAHGYQNTLTVIQALKTAVNNGVISKKLIDDSVYKIIHLKHKYNLTNSQINTVDVSAINHSIRSLLKANMP